MHQLRRIGLTYYVRFTIPRDRWADCGCREVVRTLQTRDFKEAHKRRAAALEAIRHGINSDLTQRGLRPLENGWAPDWAEEAMRLRMRHAAASADDDIDPETGEGQPWGSPRDLVRDEAQERAEDLEVALGPVVSTRFYRMATGAAVSLSVVSQRWLRDAEAAISKQTAQKHDKALRRLGEFLTSIRDAGPSDHPLSLVSIDDITRPLAGEFVEWLSHTCRLAPKTVGNTLSSLSAMWTWALRRGLCTAHVWEKLGSGLKHKADRIARTRATERPYRDDELVALLRANPAEGRRWSYGAAIFDTLRLSLLTGMRQNEVASLRRCDILREGTGVHVDRAVAKTPNSVRSVPLHPLAQRIIRDRIAGLPPSEDPLAPIFPELPPGGYDKKRSHRLALTFRQFRVSVLGPSEEVDFHSLRRTFATYWEHAQLAGAAECSDTMRNDLLGHARGDVTGSSYIAKDLGWERATAAIDAVVRLGMPEKVRKALEETAANRPPLPAKLFRPPRPARSIKRPRGPGRGQPSPPA